MSQPLPLKPRKTPSQPRAAGTVAAIIEAAAQVLETEGFEGFNTNAIARRAGVSIGSLYQYFPGKDALTIALMNREADRFYEDARAMLDEPTGEAALDSRHSPRDACITRSWCRDWAHAAACLARGRERPRRVSPSRLDLPFVIHGDRPAMACSTREARSGPRNGIRCWSDKGCIRSNLTFL